MGKGPRIDCSQDEVRTQQNAAEECDINYIVERAKRGADLSHLMQRMAPMYGDFSEVPTDLRDCLNKVRYANELFMNMDAQVRKRFDNDPAKMLDFLNDPKNRDEAISLGLVKPPPAAPPKDESLETLKSIDNSLKANSGAKKSKRSDDE